jgi:acetyl-CoA C-acetyltransferase
MKNICIISATRTPVGSFNGRLTDYNAPALGAIVIKDVLSRAQIDISFIDEVIMGSVLQAGAGQNIARQSAINAGLSNETPCMTINMVCGSGLKAIMLATQAIAIGDSSIVVAGGTENMSAAPYLLKQLRWGSRMGDVKAIDSMLIDGLTDAFSANHMGITAENIVTKFGISRREQDEFAVCSQQKAETAIKSGRHKDEIVPITIWQKNGESILFDTDENPRFGMSLEKLANLKPAFLSNGTVTAGNSSGINDGAAAVLIMAGDKAKELGLIPLTWIKAYATAGVDPQYMGLGVIPAIKKVLKNADLEISDIGLFEINEAFAAQALAVIKELNINAEITNVNGGAIAIGHPIGASGARVLVTLQYEMRRRGVRYGLAALCVGGGMGVAMILENKCDDCSR